MISDKRWAGKLLTCCFLLFVFVPHNAQDSLKTSLKSKATEYYIKKDFTHALPLYRELLNLYPKDSYYQYHTAICLLNINQNLEEVINLMRLVSANKEYPLSTFYMGRAFHWSYDFDEAVKAYSRFLSTGKKSDIRKLKVQQLIEMAKNGRDLTRFARILTTRNASITPTYLLENAYSLPTSGKVIRKPDEFNTKYDQKMNFSSLMYLPDHTEIDDFVYVPGYNESGKRGKEIFRIQNINPQTWGMPELLGEVINTPSDEDYPFFDTCSSTLYFSSEGHSSMGGYDLFKTVYNRNTKAWSKPVNLGFPINSPYDDYMLVTDETGKIAQFASNRSTGPGMVTLYRIDLKDDFTSVNSLTLDEIRKLSALPVSVDISETLATQSDATKTASSSLEVIEENTEHATFRKNEYNLIIAEALSLQLRADSLSRIARDQRIIAREIPDSEAKKQLISDIHIAEREAKKIQYEADEKFLVARKMKNSNDTLPESDTNLVFFKEVNGIRVYQYKVRDSLEINVAEFPEPSVTVTERNKIGETTPVNQFEILKDSPYSETNPIPSLPAGTTGLIYRIQLGVFSKPKEISAFGGLYPLYAEWLAEKNVYKYYTGSFTSSESVSAALEKVRNNGFPDAFIVAYYDAKPITTEKAKEIEFAGLKL